MNALGCCGDPSCNQDREQKMVVIKECDESGRGGVWCDPCIAPLVSALNQAGLQTVASCCGHGHRPGAVSLADGRELLILPDLETFHRVNALFPVDINGHVRSVPSPPPPPPKRVISEEAPGWSTITGLLRKLRA